MPNDPGSITLQEPTSAANRIIVHRKTFFSTYAEHRISGKSMNWQVQENQIRDIGFKPEVLDRTSKHGEKSSLNLWSATSAGLNVTLK